MRPVLTLRMIPRQKEKQKKKMDKQKGAKLEICKEGLMPQLIKEDEEDDKDNDNDEEW